MSLMDTPDIQVNGRTIMASAIDAEMQYHPAGSRREAMNQAVESLIIAEIVRQRARSMGLTICDDDDAQDAAIIESMLEQEFSVPEITELECRRYYESNRKAFCTSPLVEARHILLASDPMDIDDRANTLDQAQQLVEWLDADITRFEELASTYSS